MEKNIIWEVIVNYSEYSWTNIVLTFDDAEEASKFAQTLIDHVTEKKGKVTVSVSAEFCKDADEQTKESEEE